MIGSVIFTLIILIGLWVWLTKNNYFVKDKKQIKQIENEVPEVKDD